MTKNGMVIMDEILDKRKKRPASLGAQKKLIMIIEIQELDVSSIDDM